MSRVQHYISLIIFTAGFVLGVQIPNFIDQYSKRVDAHLIEATNLFAGYQALANDQQGGDIDALILKHESSSDPTFRAEATLIRGLQSNIEQYQDEAAALVKGVWPGLIHIALQGSAAIRQETINSYSANLPLNFNAMTCGFILAILFCVLWELLLTLLRGLFRWPRRRHHSKPKYASHKPSSHSSSSSRRSSSQSHRSKGHPSRAGRHA